MDPQSIILIVGVAVLILERLFSCINRIKTSKCCGGELQLTTGTPPKKGGLNDSQQTQEIDKRINDMLDVVIAQNQKVIEDNQLKIEEIQKRVSSAV